MDPQQWFRALAMAVRDRMQEVFVLKYTVYIP
jgi:hypothetical protein